MESFPTGTKPARLDERSRELRRQMVRMLEAGRRGHLASALSVLEILRVLYDDVLRYDSENPKWHDRDRCILSKLVAFRFEGDRMQRAFTIQVLNQ